MLALLVSVAKSLHLLLKLQFFALSNKTTESICTLLNLLESYRNSL